MRGGGFSLIVIILIVMAGVYYLSGGMSPALNTPVAVLDAIEADTEIPFTSPEDLEFRWNSENAQGEIADETVSGTQIKTAAITREQVDLVYGFIESQGFEEDIMNAADGITGSLRGYVKGDLVCTVLSEVVKGIEGLELDPITYDVIISCGVFEQPEVEKIEGTDEEQIAALFADKYDKDVSEVEVVMENRVKVFAKGGVKFAGEPGGGMWLAFDGDNGWELVFDGNGSIPCADIEGYDFPTDMVPECTDADGALVTLA